MAFSVTDGRGSDVLAVSAIMIALSTIAVALRFWGRHIAQSSSLWWDDWLSLAALPFIWAICALSIYWAWIGLGQHIIHAKQPHAHLGLVLFATNLLYTTGLTLVKLSVLMFYARVLWVVCTYRIAFWMVGFMIVAWCVAMDSIALFACMPIQIGWDPSIPGHCLERQFTWACIPNIITDLVLLVLPMPMLWHLQTPMPRKIALIGVFAAGYLVPFLSIVRMVFVIQDNTKPDTHPTWISVSSQILLICEVAIALVSSCLPNIFALLKHAAQADPLRSPAKSNRVSSTAIFRKGNVRRPIQERRESGSMQVEGTRILAESSIKSLVGDEDLASSLTTHNSDMT